MPWASRPGQQQIGYTKSITDVVAVGAGQVGGRRSEQQQSCERPTLRSGSPRTAIATPMQGPNMRTSANMANNVRDVRCVHRKRTANERTGYLILFGVRLFGASCSVPRLPLRSVGSVFGHIFADIGSLTGSTGIPGINLDDKMDLTASTAAPAAIDRLLGGNGGLKRLVPLDR
jgi:hypothetical protein